VPGAGLAGICGVKSGNAAPLVGGPPGVELHTVVAEPPTGGSGDMVPVVLPVIDVEIVPNGVDDIVVVDNVDVVDGVIAVVPAVMDVETVLGGVDTVGTVMEGGGRGGGVGGGGAGTVELGKSVMNDVAGCADTVR
jgi:hypothetical protein